MKGNTIFLAHVGTLHSQQLVLNHSKNVSVLFLELEDCSDINILGRKNNVIFSKNCSISGRMM